MKALSYRIEYLLKLSGFSFGIFDPLRCSSHVGQDTTAKMPRQ
jgi:hypothetical protein